MEKIPLRRYSEAFKKQVVREYEAGAAANSLREKYGIKGCSTISNRLKKYGREDSRYKLMVIQKPEEQEQVRQLKKRVQELEKAVDQLTLDKLMLEALVVIEAETGEAVKKISNRRH